MESKRLKVPETPNYERAYGLSYNLACEKLAKVVDIEELCRKTATECRTSGEGKVVLVKYIDRLCQVTFPGAEVAAADGGPDIVQTDRIIILHYLLTAKGTPPANRLITFRELPEGGGYFPTFLKRTVKPVLDRFGKMPELMVEAAGKLGGRRASYGDTAVTIDALPRVPVTVVIWRGDEEFPPEGNILFDATIPDYLPTEDITAVCQTLAWKLVRVAPA